MTHEFRDFAYYVDGYEAICSCGWRSARCWSSGVAYRDYINHHQAAWRRMDELQALQTLLNQDANSKDWVAALKSLSPKELARLATICFELHGAALNCCVIKKAGEGTLITRTSERTNTQ